MKPNAIILFDGICNLCNGAVQFIIRHDPEGYYSFAALQSDFAKNLLEKLSYKGAYNSSIIFVDGDKVYTQSTAVLKISRQLSGGWKLARILLIIPRFIRDGVYHFIARNRYRWFGKRESCMLPTPELQQRFLA